MRGNILLATIVAMVCAGAVSQASTTAGAHGAGKPEPTPAPTYPPARYWHAFTSNGGDVVEAGRIYMYGGNGADQHVVPAEFWHYSAYLDTWTLVSPAGRSRPGPRAHAGLSCGGGACVLATGTNGVSLVNETWVYRESTNAWARAACRGRAVCPSVRQMVAMAFDPGPGNHLLFGGRGSQAGLDDTWTFDPASLKWTLQTPASKPAERNRAAALHVPGVGVVIHGGQPYNANEALCDMHAWDGSSWKTISFDDAQPYPCLHSHSLGWDGQMLVITGGFVDTSDTPNTELWRFTFAADGESGTWSKSTSQGSCRQVLGTDDGEIHADAKMAYDIPAATRVWFGGSANIEGVTQAYGNTIECY